MIILRHFSLCIKKNPKDDGTLVILRWQNEKETFLLRQNTDVGYWEKWDLSRKHKVARWELTRDARRGISIELYLDQCWWHITTHILGYIVCLSESWVLRLLGNKRRISRCICWMNARSHPHFMAPYAHNGGAFAVAIEVMQTLFHCQSCCVLMSQEKDSWRFYPWIIFTKSGCEQTSRKSEKINYFLTKIHFARCCQVKALNHSWKY